jgi:hypothetical protein
MPSMHCIDHCFSRCSWLCSHSWKQLARLQAGDIHSHSAHALLVVGICQRMSYWGNCKLCFVCARRCLCLLHLFKQLLRNCSSSSSSAAHPLVGSPRPCVPGCRQDIKAREVITHQSCARTAEICHHRKLLASSICIGDRSKTGTAPMPWAWETCGPCRGRSTTGC